MTYTAKYRAPKKFLWKTVKNVEADGVEPGLFRYLVLENGEQFHIPLNSEVWFSKGRHEAIAKKMKQESGGQVNP